MSIFKSLRKIFGWRSSVRPIDRPDSRDALTSYDVTRTPADYFHDELSFKLAKRKDRYDVYDAMDQMSDVSSVLDAYSEDACQLDHKFDLSIWVESDDKRIRDELMWLLHKQLTIESWVEGNCRDLGKYGDDFARVSCTPEHGITSLFWLDPRDVERVENLTGILLGFEKTELLGQFQQQVNTAIQSGADGTEVKLTYEPWDILHFRLFRRKRLPGEKSPNIYGTSLLAGSERIAKQTKILDDLLMIMRLTKSLDRNTYYVDVGRSAIDEEIKILKRWKRALQRKTYIDPASGRFDSRFDPTCWTEDTYWATKEGSSSKVETHAGITNVADIVDIEHFRDKFFGSLRAPKAYFGYEGEYNSRSALSSQSLKWARAVAGLQRGVKQGIKRLCQIHLGYREMDTSADKFEIMMTAPSLVEQLDKLEAWQSIVDVAERLSTMGDALGLDKLQWTKYILENVLWLSKQEVEKYTPQEQQGYEQGGQEVGRELPPGPSQGQQEPAQKPQPAQLANPVETRLLGAGGGSNGHRLKLAELDEVIQQVVRDARLRSSSPGR